jgi:hypothetical protein
VCRSHRFSDDPELAISNTYSDSVVQRQIVVTGIGKIHPVEIDPERGCIRCRYVRVVPPNLHIVYGHVSVVVQVHADAIGGDGPGITGDAEGSQSIKYHIGCGCPELDGWRNRQIGLECGGPLRDALHCQMGVWHDQRRMDLTGPDGKLHRVASRCARRHDGFLAPAGCWANRPLSGSVVIRRSPSKVTSTAARSAGPTSDQERLAPARGVSDVNPVRRICPSYSERG